MLNSIGKFLQHLRTENSEMSKEMATKLDVTPTFFSGVCNGREKCPDSWYEKVPVLYSLDENLSKQWKGIIIQSNQNLKLMYDNLSESDKNLIMSLANILDTLTAAQKKLIWKVINGEMEC
ncbi:MAG: hypothetical protein LBM38_06240 [Clostridiales bacterium]|jgi:hypothetical protein|nr:hypothetical protein [Clostridiales bacterium]